MAALGVAGRLGVNGAKRGEPGWAPKYSLTLSAGAAQKLMRSCQCGTLSGMRAFNSCSIACWLAVYITPSSLYCWWGVGR
jgi:hypothetical protein